VTRWSGAIREMAPTFYGANASGTSASHVGLVAACGSRGTGRQAMVECTTFGTTGRRIGPLVMTVGSTRSAVDALSAVWAVPTSSGVTALR
jgi:hypothetical protein